MQAFIWPTTPEFGTQAIISKWRDRDKAGAALIITKENGSLALCLGNGKGKIQTINTCLLYTSPSPRDGLQSRMPSSA